VPAGESAGAQPHRGSRRLRSIVHIAQTARREAHSGLVSSLKEPERADPEWKQCDEAPGTRCAQSNQQNDEEGGAREPDKTQPTPLRLAARSDVRDEGDASAS